MGGTFYKNMDNVFIKTKRYSQWVHLRSRLPIYNNAELHRQRCKDDREMYILCKRFGDEIIKFKISTRILAGGQIFHTFGPVTVLYHINDTRDHDNLRLKLRNITHLSNYRFIKCLPFVIREIIKFTNDCDEFFVNGLTELVTTGVKSKMDSLIGKFKINLKV